MSFSVGFSTHMSVLLKRRAPLFSLCTHCSCIGTGFTWGFFLHTLLVQQFRAVCQCGAKLISWQYFKAATDDTSQATSAVTTLHAFLWLRRPGHAWARRVETKNKRKLKWSASFASFCMVAVFAAHVSWLKNNDDDTGEQSDPVCVAGARAFLRILFIYDFCKALKTKCCQSEESPKGLGSFVLLSFSFVAVKERTIFCCSFR